MLDGNSISLQMNTSFSWLHNLPPSVFEVSSFVKQKKNNYQKPKQNLKCAVFIFIYLIYLIYMYIFLFWVQESFQRFPVEISYMPEVMKRLSLARQIDKILRKDSQVICCGRPIIQCSYEASCFQTLFLTFVMYHGF